MKRKKTKSEISQTIIYFIVIAVIVIGSILIFNKISSSPCSNYGIKYKNKEIIKYFGKNESLKIPVYIDKIGENSFASDLGYAPRLKFVQIPGNVKTIGEAAFMYGNIETVIMEEGVKKIGNHAFSDTYKLKRIVLPSTIKAPLKVSMFNVEENRTNTVEYICVKGSYACSFYKKNEEALNVTTKFKLIEVKKIDKYLKVKSC